MIQSILILDSGTQNLAPLREAFQVEVRPEDEVRLVPTLKEILAHESTFLRPLSDLG